MGPLEEFEFWRSKAQGYFHKMPADTKWPSLYAMEGFLNHALSDADCLYWQHEATAECLLTQIINWMKKAYIGRPAEIQDVLCLLQNYKLTQLFQVLPKTIEDGRGWSQSQASTILMEWRKHEAIFDTQATHSVDPRVSTPTFEC